MKKQITDPKRKRRQVYVHDDIYKEVSKEAIDRDVDNGKIIEEALKQYFGGDERQG